MMKYVILAVVCFVGVLARPQQSAAPAPGSPPAASGSQPKQNVTIVESTSDNDGMGNFKWSFKTSDGQQSEQSGHTEAPAEGSTDAGIVVSGSYQYVGPDGKTYMLTYVADKNGFQPKGDFLPTSPTIGPASGAKAASSGAKSSAAASSPASPPAASR